MTVIMHYYGMELLGQIRDAYLKRYGLALERGFNDPASKYFWLYDELRYRLEFLHQMELFLNALPKFIATGAEDDAVRYVVRYATRFFSNENCGEVKEEDGHHPFFNDANGYYRDLTESMNHIDPDYDLSNHPLLLVDLTECAVRAARLYLQIRERQFHAIDRDRFDALMQKSAQLPVSA